MKRYLVPLLAAALLFRGEPVAASRCTILVNKWDNSLRFYETGKPMRQFRVATGLYKCTPEGAFRIVQKSFISRTGRSPFGTRWMGLNTLGKRGLYHIGIHGTNRPDTIGKYASKACVRMRNADINWLYGRVPFGTTVRVVDIVVKPKIDKAAPAGPLMAWCRQPPRLDLASAVRLSVQAPGPSSPRPLSFILGNKNLTL